MQKNPVYLAMLPRFQIANRLYIRLLKKLQMWCNQTQRERTLLPDEENIREVDRKNEIIVILLGCAGQNLN